MALEAVGRLELPDIGFALTGKVDRVDRLQGGSLAIYDYKSGSPPNANVQKYFDKQLLLSAAMAQGGALEEVSAAPVAEIGYIGLKGIVQSRSLEAGEIETVLGELTALIARYQRVDQGYAALRAIQRESHVSDYQHLARFGEWSHSDRPVPEAVGG